MPGSSAAAQGMAEMGAVNGMSAGMGSGLFNNGLPNALGGAYSKSAAGVGAGAPAVSQDYSIMGDGGVDARIVVKTAARDSNHLFQMAQMKEKAGMLAEAEKYYKQSLYIRERIWQDQDPAVPKIIELIGDIAVKRGNLKEAEECYHRALSDAVKRYGVGEYQLCNPLQKLGQACFKEKKFGDACNYLQQAYLLRSRKLGDANRQVTDTALALAKAYMENDSAPEASELLRKVIDAHTTESNTPQMIALLDIYAKSLRKQNKIEEAARIEVQIQSVKPAQPPEKPVSAAGTQTKTDSKAATTAAPVTVAPGSTPVVNLQDTQVSKSGKQDSANTTSEVKTQTVTK